MPKAKTDTFADSQKKKTIAEKHTKTYPNPLDARREYTKMKAARNVAGRLIASMNLDEMLEASQIVDMGIRGEKIPEVMSPKVRRYVWTAMRLNKRPAARPAVKQMQQHLTIQIIEENKKTTDAEEGKRLYLKLMDED